MIATSAHFSINLPGDTPITQVLDIWQPEMPAAAFALGPVAAIPQEITWRGDFAAPSVEAQAMLAAPYAKIAAVESALEQADHRLAAYMTAQPGAVLPPPEQILAGMLVVSAQPASFALDDPWGKQWTTAAQSARKFLAQVRQMLNAYAWVETAVGGQLIARTRVGWTGDFDTTCKVTVSAQIGQQHAETVALALASRAVWVRFAGHMIAGALRLGQWLAVPGGAAAALPGLWRYLNDMIDEYRRIQRATHS